VKFADLLGTRENKQVGKVVDAFWDPGEHGIRFTILFEPSMRRVKGVCRAGDDPVSGKFISEQDLRAKLSRFKGIPVHENPLGGDPNTMSLEEFRAMKIELSFSNLSIGYQSPSRKVGANSFISRLFR
jgi:hypothetical protein